MHIHDLCFAELSANQFHQILQLRVDVFVVEQNCAYPELDGRDPEPGTRHIWAEDDRGVQTYLRLLDDGTHRSIGRVVTRPDARSRGQARALIDHVLATSSGPWHLNAQTHLVDWYLSQGFVVSGPEFVEDGIPHQPMIRS